MSRLQTTTGTLARRGFQNTETAVRTLAQWEPHAEALIGHLEKCADPDLGLVGLARITDHRPDLPGELASNPVLARQLISVLGASQGLHQHFLNRPEAVDLLAAPVQRTSAAELRRELLLACGADPDDERPSGPGAPDDKTVGDGLRMAYRDAVVRIAARDLTTADPSEVVDDIAEELSDVADAVLEGALALARGQVGDEAQQVRLAILALGKCGARELNYVSDVDVLYVAEPLIDDSGDHVMGVDRSVDIATMLVSKLSQICSAHTAAGTIWQVDAALRPEGKAGPLVRTLSSHRAYYDKWAKDWEFQAMLKARPAAGDRALGQDFVDMVAPKVWAVGEHPHFVSEVQAMRKRVVSLIPAKEANREIKLGEGGLRDVEFTVQLLQLVHGRADERLRCRGTFEGLRALVDHGYVGRGDGAEFAAAYRFQRAMEHRVQLYRMRRTHLVPTSGDDLRRLGRSLGWLRNAADEVTKGWQTTRRRVVGLHRRMFYSPLLAAVAELRSDEVRLTTDSAMDRLRALGYLDPKAALRHIQALISGQTRTAEIQRQLMPAMLGWFAHGANPDAGLLAFRQVSDELGATSWYLRALRDEGAMAQRLATILTASRYAAGLLKRSPEAVQLLADEADLVPRTRDQLVRQMSVAARRHGSAEKQIDAVRAIRRRELFRIAVGDILELTTISDVGRGLSDLASASIEVALDVVRLEAAQDLADLALPPISVIAMGRWGGREMSYASDADVMFVIGDGAGDDGTRAVSSAIARLRSLLNGPGAVPGLELDADLRPEGKGGPLVRSEAAYLAYYREWSSTWEQQALLRAAHGAGDRSMSDRILAAVDRLRYPDNGLTDHQISEIRRLKARMETERMSRGQDPRRHTKLGPGSLSDVEWTVQLLQLQHAHDHENLRTPCTLEALAALEANDLITADDATALREAWIMASQIRDRVMLVRGRASDSLPTDTRDLAAVAQLMGYGPHDASQLIEDYRRTTRHSRAVVERLFWGE